MKRFGICSKCGEYKEVREHHHKGYGTDDTKKYCYSCDFNAHIRARKEGRCNLTHGEARVLSSNSYTRRILKKITFYEAMLPNIRLYESLFINSNTDCISVCSGFIIGNNQQIKTIGEDML